MVLDPHLEEAAAQPVAGVVHEQVDGVDGVGQTDLDPLELSAVGEVDRHHLDRDVVDVPDLLGDGAQPVLVTRDEDQVVPGAGQLPAELESQP